MRCQKCDEKEATSHENVRNEDGTWTEVHLCEKCSGKGLGALTPAGIMQALIEGASSMSATQEAEETPSCPSCGMTYADFRARGRLGCGRDYEVFEGELMPLLERIHQGGSQHVGKSPDADETRSEAERELIELRRGLADAVQREQYEEAARLRDRIQAVEEEIRQERAARAEEE
ncbi:MAG: UvrB/UvrC motif-containing protein [Planctomycetota bacterium]|jgi:protein arginine kinase activator